MAELFWISIEFHIEHTIVTYAPIFIPVADIVLTYRWQWLRTIGRSKTGFFPPSIYGGNDYQDYSIIVFLVSKFATKGV